MFGLIGSDWSFRSSFKMRGRHPRRLHDTSGGPPDRVWRAKTGQLWLDMCTRPCGRHVAHREAGRAAQEDSEETQSQAKQSPRSEVPLVAGLSNKNTDQTLKLSSRYQILWSQRNAPSADIVRNRKHATTLRRKILQAMACNGGQSTTPKESGMTAATRSQESKECGFQHAA